MMYATLSHRKIRGWAHLRKVEQHNDRDIITPAREAGRPMPVELIDGPGDMVDRTRVLLTKKEVSHTLRKNSVLAYEDVFGASPEYWDRRFPQGWRNVSTDELRRDPLIIACVDHVRAMYGDKLVSVRLHVDEKSPHLHVVSIPLVTRLHKQRGRKRKDGVEPSPAMKTTLYASADRGGSGRRLELEHDKWAAAVAHIQVDGLGLERGRRGSDLTEEERRDRRLRDDKASRQGEERARIRAEEKAASKAAKADWDRAAKMTADAAQTVADMFDGARREIAERAVEAERREERAAVAEERAAAAQEQTDRQRADADRVREDAARALRQAERDAETTAQARAAAERDSAAAAADRTRATAQREAAVADRELAARDRAEVADAVSTTALTDRQLALVDRAARDDTLGLVLDDGPRGVTMREAVMNDRERDAYRAPWSAVARSIARAVAQALARARDAIAAALAEARRHREEMALDRQRHFEAMEGERRELNIAKIMQDKHRKTAKDFMAAWEAIPEAERAPPVKAALAKAGILAQAARLAATDSAQAKGVRVSDATDLGSPRGPSRER